MARIAGVDLPKDKRIVIGLTYIFGIGPSTARRIIKETGISPDTRVHALTAEEEGQIRSVIERNFIVEGELRTQVSRNIQRLMEISSYRGLRHRLGLPVRGQRTHTNARTRRGPRRTVGVKRKSK